MMAIYANILVLSGGNVRKSYRSRKRSAEEYLLSTEKTASIKPRTNSPQHVSRAFHVLLTMKPRLERPICSDHRWNISIPYIESVTDRRDLSVRGSQILGYDVTFSSTVTWVNMNRCSSAATRLFRSQRAAPLRGSLAAWASCPSGFASPPKGST